MRPVVLLFAPLFLLPLACTDTPSEPETEETALFSSDRPEAPGTYLYATVDDCNKAAGKLGGEVFYASVKIGLYGDLHVIGCGGYPTPTPTSVWVPTPGVATILWHTHTGLLNACAPYDGMIGTTYLPAQLPTDRDSKCYGFLNLKLVTIK